MYLNILGGKHKKLFCKLLLVQKVKDDSNANLSSESFAHCICHQHVDTEQTVTGVKSFQRYFRVWRGGL